MNTKEKKNHLRVKLVSYEKNKPEVLSAIFSSAENSASIFFCKRLCTDHRISSYSNKRPRIKWQCSNGSTCCALEFFREWSQGKTFKDKILKIG